MQAVSYIAIGVILLIIAGAVIKLIRDRKKGIKCTGCAGCPALCQDCSHCGTHISG